MLGLVVLDWGLQVGSEQGLEWSEQEQEWSGQGLAESEHLGPVQAV